jgi:hypothetical protein
MHEKWKVGGSIAEIIVLLARKGCSKARCEGKSMIFALEENQKEELSPEHSTELSWLSKSLK